MNELIKTLEEQQQLHQRAVQQTRAAIRMEKMRLEREQRRKAMTPEQLAVEDKVDADYHAVFTTDAGAAVLNHMAQNFPAIANGFMERVERHEGKLKAQEDYAAAGHRVAAAAAAQVEATGGQ